MNDATPLLDGRGLSKHYGTVRALWDVDLSVYRGQVTCVLGDNGAGKSTLIKILSGVEEPSAGELLIDGRPTRLRSPREARTHGIAAAHQNLATMPLMSIWRNFFLGCEPTRPVGPFRVLDVRAGRRIAREEMLKIGLEIRDPEQVVGTLSGGERQAVAIARALYFGARLLILDEPTSALGVKQTANVLRFVSAARDRGAAVIFVTHNPYHAYPVGDRFVILNRGRLAGTWERDGIDQQELTASMAGGHELDELARELRKPPVAAGGSGADPP